MSTAVYSSCQTYRYLLRREWDERAKLLFILLNPSTATEERNDPTIERCERRARASGFGGFAVANIFALRSTDPAGLRRVIDPVGPDNAEILAKAAHSAGLILCGWGTHGALDGRGQLVRNVMDAQGIQLWHLGLTRDGHPRHPLYVSYATLPQLWKE